MASDLSNWNISSALDLSNMFYNATLFESDLSRWDTSRVGTMPRVFYNASSFNSDLSMWDVSQVSDMSMLFYNSVKFNSDLNNWKGKHKCAVVVTVRHGACVRQLSLTSGSYPLHSFQLREIPEHVLWRNQL